MSELLTIKKISHHHFVFIILILGFLLFVGGALTMPLGAQVTPNIWGWAWSDNIGWISFNCTNTDSCGTSNYGVYIDDQGGEMSGYAWGDNIGWISFNEADLDDCPSGSCRAKLSGNSLQGWAKALAAGEMENGDWDGWISLEGSQYEVTLDNDVFEGYAWGSEVIGWIDFAPQTGFGGVYLGEGPPSVSLSADPTQVAYNTNTTLSWAAENVDTCAGSGGTPDWPGAKATTGSQAVGPITATTTYVLSCDSVSGEATSSVIITAAQSPPTASLSANPQVIEPTETSNLTWGSTEAETCSGVNFSTGGATSGTAPVSPSATTNYTVTCTNDAGSAQAQTAVTVIVPEVDISASPIQVQSGGSTTITWTSTDVEECAVTGPGGFSYSTLSGSAFSGALVQESTFTISCTTLEEEVVGDSVTVLITPTFEEF